MSGFIGIISPQLQQQDSDLLDNCQEEIVLCCDDFSGAWKSNNADLRFGWLKTTDDTNIENLPFTSDQNLYIIGDVLLENRLKLISELNKIFADISSITPDVYLLLYAYQLWGEDCLAQISGDYAFAIWNEKERTLFCARDHFGAIPFYYAQTERGFLFTNFYRSLKCVPGLTSDLNEDVLKDYFFSSSNQSFDHTIYQKIKKLPPAHQLTYQEGNLQITRYWEMSDDVKPIRYKTTKEYVTHFSGLFEQSIADRTRNNKICCALSGGMDSSSVTAITNKILTSKYKDDRKLMAFNITYEYLVNENEGYFAQNTAKHLDITLKQYIAEDYLQHIASPINSWIPEPAGLPQAIAESHIIDDAGTISRVFLGGFGGDPVFEYDPNSSCRLIKQGYYVQPLLDRIKFFRVYGRFSQMSLLGRIRKLVTRAPTSIPTIPKWFDQEFFSADYMQRKIVRNELSPRSNLGMLSNTLWSFLFEISHPGFTGKKIKIRQPFFSLELLLFLRAMPPHLLYQKSLLRMAMIPHLPGDVVRRPKSLLFGTPHFQNLKSPGILSALKEQVAASCEFLKDKINLPAFLAEIDSHDHLKVADHGKVLALMQILAWKNYDN
ncbi:MAG: hypothetical protein JWR67_775 [Mucilaginibacter sp.]|nr:hypothetical protein [Mucilaginibacter sp.]